jgi:hypothetical protein
VTLTDRKEAARLYQQGESGGVVAKKYGVNWKTLKKYLILDGVELRTKAEANRLMEQPNRFKESRSALDKNLCNQYQSFNLRAPT